MKYLAQTARIATPAILENLFNSAILLVDALVVARLGESTLAAVAITGVPLWRLRSMLGVLQIGCGVTIARRWGAGDFVSARRLLSHGVVLGFLLGGVSLLTIPFAGGIFRLLGAQGEVLTLAAGYFSIVVASYPFCVASSHMTTGFRAAGDTRTPMVTRLLINVLNLALNIVLVFGKFGFPKMGLMGSGLATAIAFSVEFLILFAVARRGVRPRRIFTASHVEQPPQDDEPIELTGPVYTPASADTTGAVLRFDPSGWKFILPRTTRAIVALSTPPFFEELAVSVGFLGFIHMITTLGNDALAAHTCVSRLESFSYNAGFGVSVATATLVGQSLGAGSLKDARRFFSISVSFAVSLMAGAAIIFASAPGWFLGWFAPSPDAAYLPLAIAGILVMAIEQPFIAAGMVLAGGLRGAGMTKAPFVTQLIGAVGVRLGLGYLFGFVWGYGLIGIYWATVLDWVLRTVILSAIALGRSWERIKV
ncbi:MATE family efflux transporter [soil metagenome]